MKPDQITNDRLKRDTVLHPARLEGLGKHTHTYILS